MSSKPFNDVYETTFLNNESYNEFLCFIEENSEKGNFTTQFYSHLPEPMEDMIRRSRQALGIKIEERDLFSLERSMEEKIKTIKR